FFLLLLLLPLPPRSTLFPYTTLFRSALGVWSRVKTSLLLSIRIVTGPYQGSVYTPAYFSSARDGFESAARPASWVFITSAASFSDRKSTRLNSSLLGISYAVFCLKKK